MIRVLVLANESLFAESVVAVLSRESNLDVVHMSHREFGKGGHYSIIIIIDEEDSHAKPIKLIDLIRENVTSILIKLSLENRNVYVFESYRLLNPEMDQVLDLLREFSRKRLGNQSEEDTGLQKKMNEPFIIQIGEHIRNQSYFPAEHLFEDVLALNSNN